MPPSPSLLPRRGCSLLRCRCWCWCWWAMADGRWMMAYGRRATGDGRGGDGVVVVVGGGRCEAAMPSRCGAGVGVVGLAWWAAGDVAVWCWVVVVVVAIHGYRSLVKFYEKE